MIFKDKIIVITGGAGGLGKELAKLLIFAGAKIVLSDFNQAELEKTAGELNPVATIKTDVRKQEEVNFLAEETVRRFDRIDIWINNAGVWLPHAPSEELNMEKVHNMFEVNVFGLIYGTLAAYGEMRKKGEGTIVNIISISALSARLGSSAYCASKFAADGFTKSFRLEASPLGISVFSVYPGSIKTNLFDEAKPENFAEYMEPSEVASRLIANLKQDRPEEEFIITKNILPSA